MLLLAPLFTGLGFWQLDRAEQKRNLASMLEQRRKMPAVPVSDALRDNAEFEYREFSAEGKFLEEKTVLIENRKHRGKNGFHVITPMRLSQGRILLVNRGWIPATADGNATVYDSPKDNLVIEGEARVPRDPALQLGEVALGGEETPRWPYLTLEQYHSWSGLDILPFVLLQAPDKNSGFERSWPPPSTNEMMHIGYALQWFAFACITLLIWLKLSIHKRTEALAL